MVIIIKVDEIEGAFSPRERQLPAKFQRSILKCGRPLKRPRSKWKDDVKIA
jgi:hypothetical protein